jgi:hypothetical protein
MLRIGRQDRQIVVAEILPDGYQDITNITMWLGLIEKLGYDQHIVFEQIELFYSYLRENGLLKQCDSECYEAFKSGNLVY